MPSKKKRMPMLHYWHVEHEVQANPDISLAELHQGSKGTRTLVMDVDKSGKPLDTATVYAKGTRSVVVAETGRMEDGQKTGIWKVFSENGALVEKNRYLNGQLDGLQRRYNAEGNVIERAQFRKGIQHGLCQTYDDNGVINSLAYFSRNKEDMGATRKLTRTMRSQATSIVARAVLPSPEKEPGKYNKKLLEKVLAKKPQYAPAA